MCMLTGIYPVKKLTLPERKIATTILSVILWENSKMTNKDGLGLSTLDGSVVKWEDAAGNHLFSKETTVPMLDMIGRPMICHVRTASAGVNAIEGAHPFVVGHVMLAHNGTFTNYKDILKKYKDVISNKDPDPVDSHVIAHLLSDKVGDGNVTAEKILSTLSETKGSFALLIGDTVEEKLWVVAGSNPLYIQKIGPIFVVNTSLGSIRTAIDMTNPAASIMLNKTWEVEPASKVDRFTINTLDGSGLTKIADIPNVVVQTNSQTVWRGARPVYTPANNHTGSSETVEAQKRAITAQEILTLPGVTKEELDIATMSIYQDAWYNVTSDDLLILLETFTMLSDLWTSKKQATWDQIRKTTGYGYMFLADLVDMAFPFYVNTSCILDGILEEVRK